MIDRTHNTASAPSTAQPLQSPANASAASFGESTSSFSEPHDTFTTEGDLEAASRALALPPQAWRPFNHPSAKHQLFVATTPDNTTWFAKSYGTRAKDAPHNNDLINTLRAVNRGTAWPALDDAELVRRNVPVTRKITGKQLTRPADTSNPVIVQRIMKLMVQDHSSAPARSDVPSFDYVGGARGRISNLRREGIEVKIDLSSLEKRVDWLQEKLTERNLPQVFATSNVYHGAIWQLDDGGMVFTAHEDDRLMPTLMPIARLEFVSRWPISFTDAVALPAYFGRAPTSQERSDMRLIRAAINCDYYGYHCEVMGPKNPVTLHFIHRLYEDQAHISDLPQLTFNANFEDSGFVS